MRMRKLDPKAFRQFLEGNRKIVFGIRERDCPLSRWLEEEIVLEDLNVFPPWANRFHGAWEERYQWTDVPPGKGSDALAMLARQII